jgi:NADH:ubiquinone oxidoreductase subunit 5 (subunit L)/multisubunit Na+/H+ antiporter MnhA subunit
MRIYTLKAALKTFVLSRLSDMFLFAAFVLALFFFNTSDLSLIFVQIPFLSFHFMHCEAFSVHALSLLSFLIAMAGVIKSAQFCFHV